MFLNDFILMRQKQKIFWFDRRTEFYYIITAIYKLISDLYEELLYITDISPYNFVIA